MNINYHSFLQLLFFGIIALFPVVNPIGSAFIVAPYFEGLDKTEKRNAVKKITFYSFMICTVSLFAGHWILQLFGLSIPVVQLAGGIMICKIGWEFLTSDKTASADGSGSGPTVKHDAPDSIENKLFYPISFPFTTGAGTISVMFTLGAHTASPNITKYLVNTCAIVLAILVICLIIYIFYLNTKLMLNFIGSKGEQIVNRITAFLIFCVGLQIAATGIASLIKSYA